MEIPGIFLYRINQNREFLFFHIGLNSGYNPREDTVEYDFSVKVGTGNKEIMEKLKGTRKKNRASDGEGEEEDQYSPTAACCHQEFQEQNQTMSLRTRMGPIHGKNGFFCKWCDKGFDWVPLAVLFEYVFLIEKDVS